MTTQKKVYFDAQAACGLKVGDWVKVTRKAQNHEAGWDNVWTVVMNKTVNQVGKVWGIGDRGIWVCFGNPINDWWSFPYFVLEKTEKPEEKAPCQFKPFDKVLVRDKVEDVWQPAFFSHMATHPDYAFKYPYIVMPAVAYMQCIPYEGNEHLTGTTGC